MKNKHYVPGQVRSKGGLNLRAELKKRAHDVTGEDMGLNREVEPDGLNKNKGREFKLVD
jgi:hypothetical protein